MPPKPLELIIDDTLLLRQFTEGDAEVIFALIDRNREHLSQFGDGTASKYPDVESVRESIVEPPHPKRLRLGIWDVDTYVGTINLTPDDGDMDGEVGYYLGREFEGNGYMSRSLKRLLQYAFEDQLMDLVYAKVHRDNLDSIAVLERAGFVQSANGHEGEKLRYGLPTWVSPMEELGL